MIEFLADTIAIIRHFAKTGRIGLKAKNIFKGADKGEYLIYISVISIVEIMYLAESKRIPVNLEDVIKTIRNSDNYYIVDISVGIVEIAKTIKGLELHDRLIVATAKYLDHPILSCDKAISCLKEVEVIWK